MPKPYSEYMKQLVVYHHRHGLKSGDISLILQEEGIVASRRGIGKFLAKFIESELVAQKPGSGRHVDLHYARNREKAVLIVV